MKKPVLFVVLTIFSISLLAQNPGPEVTSWILNDGTNFGYNNIPSNVEQVRYSDNNVYISSSCIPGYDIGPWQGNPNTPINQNFVFKITRHPQPNTGQPVSTPLGHIGVWINGVSLYNAKDAMTYQNQGVWNRNAVLAEAISFDNCLGHPAPNGEYHLHLNPVCLYDDQDNTKHSPLLGFAFDGYPIYGCFGYANANGSGGIRRMKSSYRQRNITNRQSLPDGTVLPANKYGPDVSAQYPLGLFLEDFEYIAGSGDLDEHNGRFCMTPEYPQGMYCYFVTLDDNANAVYPYILGPTYYGTVPGGNTGPQSGHNVPSEPVLVYNPATATQDLQNQGIAVYPNPATDFVVLSGVEGKCLFRILNMEGKIVMQQLCEASGDVQIVLPGLTTGVYSVQVMAESGANVLNQKLIIH